MARILIILFCLALLAPEFRAESDLVATYSLSKQFVIYGPQGSTEPSGNKKLVALDPTFLTISCERIKQAVLTELNGADHSRAIFANPGEGKIYVVLHPGTGQTPLITPIQTLATFSYRIDLPNRIDGARLIEAVAEAVLLEIANRHSEGKFVQLPRWFSVGIAEAVKSGSPETLLLQQNLPISRSKIQEDPTVKIRKNMDTFAPLTFDELCWPGSLSPERLSHYDECAQLFVHELLRLPNGETCLQRMLQALSSHLNWQVAFLSAFQAHFQQLVDVEKWWGLRVVNLSGRDASQLWSTDQSMERLDAILRIPVQRFGGSLNPNRGVLELQDIVSNWPSDPQKIALQKVLNQLRAMRLRVQPEFVIVIDDYCSTLENYLANEKKGAIKRALSRGNLSEWKISTCERLNALDRRRTELRNRPGPSTREAAILSALEATAGRKVPQKP
ncbi:MAG: hypothetical protein ABIQ35_12930 [Verrucomicrobiota bacterium]